MAGKSDSVSIKVPYRNLRKDAEMEVEMVGEVNHRIELHSPPTASSSSAAASGGDSRVNAPVHLRSKHCGLMPLILSCTVAAGVQFGWALQLSLLTPYIQVHITILCLFSILVYLFMACLYSVFLFSVIW